MPSLKDPSPRIVDVIKIIRYLGFVKFIIIIITTWHIVSFEDRNIGDLDVRRLNTNCEKSTEK
jgi:hypothetical protein